jgi:hypothetical protein
MLVAFLQGKNSEKKKTNWKDQGVSRMDILQALKQSPSFPLVQFHSLLLK